MDRFDIAVVGGGLAGASAVESYRANGGSGSVVLLSDDKDLPVHRPSLSKGYLRGEELLDVVLVHPSNFYESNNIEVRLGSRVHAIDHQARRLSVAGAGEIEYRELVLATGATPRRLSLPGSDLNGVYYLRSLQSSSVLRAAAQGAHHAVIIGAGFIGMEVAASLQVLGVACTVVEVAPRMWARVVPGQAASAIQTYFEAKDVQFRFGIGIEAIEGNHSVSAVRLADGTVLPADLVVVGVGVTLNTALAESVGLEVEQGVIVDEYFRTSQSDIYAIGDIAAFPDPIGGRVHLEHWDNALHSGRALGATLAGKAEPFRHIAYFFSDLFDLSINMIGYSAGWDDIVFRGDFGKPQFTAVYLKEGIVRAALMVNDDTHFGAWTQLVEHAAATEGRRCVLSDPNRNPLEILENA
jgi:3-phenylpropionate/trans-cinnamate dioxygenase ferredoxin reductase subunit